MAQAIHPPISVGGIPLVGSGPPWASYDHSHGLGIKGKDIASAAALQLGPDGSYFHVTGTTTITSISKRNAGDIVVLEFDGALTFTHNATTLILQGAANRVTAAGDVFVLVSEGAGNWREVGEIATAGPTGFGAAGYPLDVKPGTVEADGTAKTLPRSDHVHGWGGMSPITNSLGADVALNNTANYFDGPSVSQGTAGTWFVSGTVTVQDSTVGGALLSVKLWDGTTVIASTRMRVDVATSIRVPIALSGYLASPAGNLRISVRDHTTATGVIEYNASGESKDSTITALRIA